MSSVIPLIDHAVLHPTQTDSDLVAACKLCRDLGAFSVCVKPYMIPSAVKLLAGSNTLVSTVIGFPHGSPPTSIKAAEARWACEQGARELDMVINVGQAQQKQWDEVEADIRAVVDVGREFNVIVKVIFEMDYFTDDEHKIELCKVSERAGAAFVKTSTGFGFVKQPDGTMATRGATDHDVALMRKSCSIEVKASGGIRSLADARRLVALGATRLGTSATETIAKQEAAEAAGDATKIGPASGGY